MTSISSGSVDATTASEWYRVAVNGSAARQHPVTVVVDLRSLAVQQLRGAIDGRAERGAERLVAEADPEDRQFARRWGSRPCRCRPLGRPRAGGEQDAVGT